MSNISTGIEDIEGAVVREPDGVEQPNGIVVPVGTDEETDDSPNKSGKESMGMETMEEIDEQLEKGEYTLSMRLEETLVPLPDDVYSMYLLSNWHGPAFVYASYVFLLKMTFYTFICLDAIKQQMAVDYSDISLTVRWAQFLILPVAVAMQEDLMTAYHAIANVRYSDEALKEHIYASEKKFYITSYLRGFDGFYSLVVNFVILMNATQVLSLFQNFAALQFLQHIDNLALSLCSKGFLTDHLKEVALAVQTIELPRKRSKVFHAMDTVLFLLTLLPITILWAIYGLLY